MKTRNLLGTKKREICVLIFFFLLSTVVRYFFANRFPIRLSTTPDEVYYYQIASGIYCGRGVQVYGVQNGLHNILYPLIVAPFFSILSINIRVKAIWLLNCILMSSGLFPVYFLSNKILKKENLRYMVYIMYCFLGHMTYSMTFLCENLYFLLCLVTVCFFYSFIINNKKSTKMYVLSFLCALMSYITYLSKETGLIFPVAYSLFCFFECLVLLLKKEKKVLAQEIKGYLTYVLTFALIFVIFNRFVFERVNGYLSRDYTSFLKQENAIGYLIYAALYYFFSVMMLSVVFPVVIPALCRKKNGKKVNQFYGFLNMLVITMSITVAFTISLAEDYGKELPRTHTRYIAWIVILFLIVFFCCIENNSFPSSLNLKQIFSLTVMAALFLLIYNGAMLGSVSDSTMWILKSIPKDYFIVLKIGCLVFTFMLIVGGMIHNNRKKVIYVLAIMIFLAIQIVDNKIAIDKQRESYDISTEEENEVQYLREFAMSTNDNVLLINYNFMTEVHYNTDLYMALDNVYESSVYNIKSEGGNLEHIELSDGTLANMAHGFVPAVKFRYIILENIYSIEENTNCKKMSQYSTKNYDFYELKNGNTNICLNEAKYNVNETIKLDSTHDVTRSLFYAGMNRAESGYAWTNGKNVISNSIKISGCDSVTDVTLRMNIVNIINGEQRIKIISKNEVVYENSITENGDLYIPLITDKDGYVSFELILPDAEMSTNGDTRTLALAISEIEFIGKEEVSLGTIYRANDGSVNKIFAAGFYDSEGEFSWTKGKFIMSRKMYLDNVSDRISFKMSISNVLNGAQRLIVTCNNEEVYNSIVESDGVIYIPISPHKDGYFEMSVFLPDAKCPNSIDTRILGLAVTEMEFVKTE